MSRSFSNQENLVSNTYDVLQRTGASLQRSNQIAYETEQIGTEVFVNYDKQLDTLNIKMFSHMQVLSELGEQRESLLRSTRRLEHADDDLSKSHAIIRKIRREVLYNKLILVLIIILELAILIGVVTIKFVKVQYYPAYNFKYLIGKIV